MVRYYSVILAINVFIALFYYFIKRNSGISPKILFSISTLSVFIGAIFPVVLGFSSLVMVIVANILLIGLGAYFITVLLGDKESHSVVLENAPEPFEILIPVEQQTTDEPAAWEIMEEVAVTEELIEEELIEESAAVEEASEIGLIEETIEETIAEETAEAESTEEEVVAEEAVEESIEETTADEEAIEEELIKETIEEIIEEIAIAEEITEEEYIAGEDLAEEVVDEESAEKTTAVEEDLEELIEDTIEEIVTNEEAAEEEFTEEDFTEEEFVAEESIEDDIIEEAVVTEEAAEEEYTEEVAVAEEDIEEEPRIPLEEEALIDIQGVESMSVLNNLSIEDPFELRDSYIMRGFDAKADGKLELAVKYFSSALELNPPSDLEFMLIIDICALLKELGQYRRAQESLEQFRNGRPNLTGEILQEVIILQKSLEILQETLTKANTPNMPFSKVPALIRVSVEEKVNQWKNEVF